MLTQVKPSLVGQRSAQTQNVQSLSFAPCVGGLNFYDPIHRTDVRDALILDNFIARPTGIELRGGYQQFATNIKNPVTILSHESGSVDEDALFVSTVGNIYDITTGGDVSQMTPVNIPNDNSGYWSFINYSMADTKYLLAVNNGAGYWVYSRDTGWIKPVIEGLPENLTSIGVWANRVWITVQNSSEVYYLQVGSILGGNASPIDYGQMFRHGGNCVAVTNWTNDGGISPNDYQVILSSSGDVLVYSGIDPSNADTYKIVGVWHIGNLPQGDKFLTKVGGDLWVLCDLGIVSLKALTTGNFRETSMDNPIIRKIQPELSKDLALHLNDAGWEMHIYPKLDILILQKPMGTNGTYHQYCLCLINNAWSTFSNMPMSTSSVFNRKYYFADNSTVYLGFENNTDNQDINTSKEYVVPTTNGTDIWGTAIMPFNHFGTPANLKKFQQVRPQFVCKSPPRFQVRMHIDYMMNDVYVENGYDVYQNYEWDSAIWDEGHWYGNTFYSRWVGTHGIGYTGALEIRLKGFPETTWVDCQFMIEGGGFY